MPYSNNVVHRARERLAEARQQRENEYRDYLAYAYGVCPDLKKIERELRGTVAELAALAFSGTDTDTAVANLRERNLQLQEERKWLIDINELNEDQLENTPLCSVCGGSGYVGARMCECLRELCRQEQRRELMKLFPTGKESFENFSLNYYPDVISPDVGYSPRSLMRIQLNKCRRYASEFRKGAPSMLLSGPTGLGKTFLSACIARQVCDAGFSVTYETASKLFTDFENVKFNDWDESLTRRYLECDLLILDDLGTEMTTQFVTAQLYTLITTRLTAGLSTIISTNLAPTELEARYSAQIGSRLTALYELVPFVGNDIRQMLRNTASHR